MNTQFKKGILELCVLSLINKSDMSGYQIVDHINEYLEVSVNTIYPILRRLTNEGVLATYEVYEGGRKRKFYVLSSIGKENYKSMYSEYLSFSSSVQRLLEGGNEDE